MDDVTEDVNNLIDDAQKDKLITEEELGAMEPWDSLVGFLLLYKVCREHSAANLQIPEMSIINPSCCNIDIGKFVFNHIRSHETQLQEHHTRNFLWDCYNYQNTFKTFWAFLDIFISYIIYIYNLSYIRC